MPKRNKYKKRANGLYEAKVMVGYKDDGRPNRISVYGYTSTEVEKKANELKYEIEHGKFANDKKTTLGRYADKWLNTYKAGKAINTRAMYKNIVEKHIDDIGHIRISEVTTSHIQQLINSRLEHPRTCQQIRMTLTQIFQAAANDGIVCKNPALA